MRRTFSVAYLTVLSLTLALAGLTPADAKKPDAPGGGNGGGGGEDDGGTTAISYQVLRLDTTAADGQVLEGGAWGVSNVLADARLVVGSVNASVDGQNVWKAAAWSVTEQNGEFNTSMRLLDDAGWSDQPSNVFGCNDSFEMVGSIGEVHATYWSGPEGAMELLPGSGTQSHAGAINKQSVACGWSGTLPEAQATVWFFVDGQWTFLTLPHLGQPGQDEEGNVLPNRSFAYAISDVDPATATCVIVGGSNDNAALWTVLVDADGLVAGPAWTLESGREATGLNNNGIACGFGESEELSGGNGVVWVDGATAEPLIPTYSKWTGNPRAVWPYDVNDHGLIVGNSFTQAVFLPSKNAEPVFLDDFLAKGRRAVFGSLSSARALNESNEIVGSGTLPDGSSIKVPFLAIPE